jgi:hypothetical protein
MFELFPLAYPRGDGVIDMELLSVIRRWRYRDHYSIREISRRAGVSVEVVAMVATLRSGFERSRWSFLSY